MEKKKTKESQYQDLLDLESLVGRTQFGLMSNQVWHDDPKRLVFMLSRYKFVSRLLEGKSSALEIGCADAFGSRIVRQTVPNITAIDFDPVFIKDAKSRQRDDWPLDLRVHDILDGPVAGEFEAAYCVDVLEHIAPESEEIFIKNVVASIDPNGMAIFGMPSLESQKYASEQSKIGHVNCKSGDQLKDLMQKHFYNAIVFSMNDEVVHTGYYPMTHYLFAVCCGCR